MYRLYQSMVDRMENFFLTKPLLTEDAHIGDTEITVDDASPFTKEGINNSFPEIFLMDTDTTFKPISNGREGASLVRIESVDSDTKITLQSPLTRDWLVSKGSFARRAIVGSAGDTSGEVVGKIVLGEVEVIDKFCAIAIIPSSKTINWKTLSSTMDKITINFIVYTKKGDNDRAAKSVLILADIVEWILMSNLHIYPVGYFNNNQRTNIARVTDINYGTIQKGSTYLKAATLTWQADMHFFRGYLTAQGRAEGVNFGYGNLSNFGPLPKS